MTTYTTLSSDAAIERTVQALKVRTNIEAQVAENRAQALEMLLAQLPEGAEVFPSTSMTLEAIGFMEYLTQHPTRYRNLRALTAAEPDQTKRAELRRRIPTVEYYIGSVHALAETGEVAIASRTGSQLAGYVFAARNVLWVIGAQKIVPNLDVALRRVREHSLPQEDARVRQGGSAQGSRIGKLLILENEGQAGRVKAILVKELLGF